MAQIPGTEDLYPFASSNSQAIPLDILKSAGLMAIAFGTSDAIDGIAIPASAEFLVCYASEDLYIQLDGAAAIPADQVFVPLLHFVPGESVKVIDFGAATTFSVVSASGLVGRLVVEFSVKWKDIRKVGQSTKIG
jgi:hypothetical protein